MGASTFFHYEPNPDPAAAFREAVTRARWDHGNGGYTGSLAEKDAFTVIDRSPIALAAAEAHARSLIHACDPRVDDKWGPAGALPIAADATPTSTSTRRVTLHNPDPRTLLALRSDRHLELVRAELTGALAPNERVLEARLLSVDATLRARHTPNERPLEIVYQVAGRGYQGGHHATLEAARAELAALAQRAQVELQQALARVTADGRVPPLRRPSEYRIFAFVNEDAGRAGLERATLEHDGETLTLEATIGRYEQDAGVQTVGWLFFGWASD